MIDSNGFPAGIAVLGEDGVEAVEAVRPRIPHDVPLPAQDSVALETGKVAHVPGFALRLRALVRQDELVASGAAGLERLGVVSAAVEPAVPIEVDEVHEELPADGAGEAARVPAVVRAGTGRQDGHVASAHGLSALGANGGDWERVGDRELADSAPAEGFPLPLSGEEPELLLLILGEGGAVTDLVVVRRQLIEQLADSVLFSDRVDVRHLVLRQYREVQMDLNNKESIPFSKEE